MEEQIKTTNGGGRRPPLECFSIIEREGSDRPVWHRVGAAWVNRDGSINVHLDSLPFAGKLQLREARERKPEGAGHGASEPRQEKLS